MEERRSLPLQNAGRAGLGWLILLVSLSSAAWCQTSQSTPPRPETRQPETPEEHSASLPLPPQQEVLVKGRRIVYYEAGKGSVVILIHGLGADAHNWGANIGPLAANYRVIALDQIGYGQSEKPVMRYTVETFVDYLHDFMVALNIPKASLVGNSLGGWVALDFAIRHPKMVEKLVLVDAAGLHPAVPLKLPEGGLQTLTPRNTRWFFDLMTANKEWATADLGLISYESHAKNGDTYTVASSLAEMATGQEFEDYKLDKVKAPTLIIWGRDDMLLPMKMGEHFHQGIAGSQMIVIDGAAHVPMMGKPDEFNAAVIKFLS